VALLYGPLVLFGIQANDRPITRSQLLAAKKTAPDKWQAPTQTGAMTLLPFFAISNEPYSTYFKVS
jgi:hypothetical protein